MRKDKELATSMRKSGRSYMEIHRALKVPRATLSDWFSKADWSNDIRKRLTDAAQEISKVRMRELDRIRGINLTRAYEEARSEAREDFERLKYHPLFIAGLMLYWGEGDKRTHGQVRLINTGAEMIPLYVFFLRHICSIPEEKIGAAVIIYPDLNAQDCIKYWSEKSGISKDNFLKCTTIQGRHKTNRLSYGICSIYVSSTYFKAKMMKWLKILPQELMNKAYYASI